MARTKTKSGKAGARLSIADALQSVFNDHKAVQRLEGGRLKFVHFTQKELAQKLGVSDRTIRRWKSGEAAPSAVHEAIIRKAAGAVRRKAVRGFPQIENFPAMQGHRRELIQWGYRNGKAYDTGKRELSDWVNYDVSAMPLQRIYDFIYQWSRTNQVQIIYEIRHGIDARVGRKPDGYYADHQHASTVVRDRRDDTYEEIVEWINTLLWRYLSVHGYKEESYDDVIAARMAGFNPNRILYVGVNMRPGQFLDT